MNTPFDYLLKRYLEGKASQDEIAELKQLAETGEYDHLVGSAVIEKLKQMKDPYPGDVYDNVNEVYERLRPLLQPSNPLPADEPAELPTTEQGSPPGRWLMAAAVIGVLILSGVYFVSIQQPKPFNEIAKTETSFRTFTGPDSVQLRDGSTLWLNTDSRLKLPEDFGVKQREVELIGEAYFDVAHDPAKPFVVRTGDILTTVLGTAFNVRAFPGEEIKVTVERGLVEVASEKRIFGKIKPDQQITVRPEADEFITEQTDGTIVSTWREKLLVLKSVPMVEAARLIGEKFNVRITVNNKDLLQCRVSGSFNKDEGLESVLSLITSLTKATYKIEGRIVAIEGGKCE